MPTRTLALSRLSSRAVLPAGRCRTTASLPAFAGALCKVLLQLLDVRVELDLVLRRQCGAEIVALCVEQLLGLLALRRRLLPRCLERGRVATLTSVSRRLHLRLELLSEPARVAKTVRPMHRAAVHRSHNRTRALAS